MKTTPISRALTQTKRNRRFLAAAPLLGLLLAGACPLSLQAQVSDTFSNGISDYSNYFRSIKTNGSPAVSVSTYGGTNALTVSGGSNVGNNGVSIVYDATPGDGTSTQNLYTSGVTVSLDFQGTTANSSIGIMLGNAAESSSLMALFNLDYTGTTDEIRFFTGSPISTNLGADTLLSAGTVTGNSGANAGGSYVHLQLTYSVSGTTPTLTLTAGSLSATYTFAAGTAIDPTEIGLRIYDVNNTTSSTYMTNFAISTLAVPEPATTAFLGMGAGLFGLVGLHRWRTRRNSLCRL